MGGSSVGSVHCPVPLAGVLAQACCGPLSLSVLGLPGEVVLSTFSEEETGTQDRAELGARPKSLTS